MAVERLSRPAACLRVIALVALLASCATKPPAECPPIGAAEIQSLIERSLPPTVSDRAGWVGDLYADLTALAIPPTHDNLCAVIAVIAQESDFRVDPVIPGLGAIAWKEIDARAERARVPLALVQEVLKLRSSTGRSYAERIDRARTEKDLSDIYEDFIGAVPLGRTLFADRNPIRTRGPMQVNVAFAEHYFGVKRFPYPLRVSIADELFTRRGSLYFGIAHLLDYQAPYDRYLYRFADYNAGQYASRNAAFQNAVGRASGMRIELDGALLPPGQTSGAGETERAVRALARRIALGDVEIHRSLERADSGDFEQTPLYRRVFALADRSAGRPLPRALVPQIVLHGPKLSRRLTTAWYASRVDARFHRCLGR